jgi:hypothetical protein
MARDAFAVALTEFRRWTKTAADRMRADPAEEIGQIEILLDLMRDYLEIDHPADLTPADLEQLLLRVYPRKITILDDSQTVDTIPSMSDFIAFLAESGALPAARARALDRELDLIAPRFGEAVMDPANWGMARSFVTAMAADGVNFDDEAAVQRWIADYNRGLTENPYDDEDDDQEPVLDLKDAFDLPDELPPVHLPPEAELAAVARQAPIIAQLAALAAWLGEDGREIGEDGDQLSGDLADAAAAAAGVDPGEFPYLWDLALESDFADVDDDELSDGFRAFAGDTALEWEDCDDAEVLEIWQLLLASVLDGTLELAAELDLDRSRDLDLTGHGIALITMLFLTSGQGIPVAEASDILRQIALDELPPAQTETVWREWVGAHGDPLRLLLRQLAALGSIRLTDEPDKGELILLTPLGRFAVRNQLLDAGVDVPLLPAVEVMTAADLLAMAEGAPEDEFDATAAEWMGYRTPETSARELLAAAAETEAAERLIGVAITTELGAAAEPAWRDCLSQVALRGYAKAALARLAGQEIPDDLEPADITWLAADTLAAAGLLDLDAEHDPAELARLLGEVVPRGQEQNAFEAMARLPHRQVAEVLTVIGRHHPDKKTAKLARRAAYKAGTRQARSTV